MDVERESRERNTKLFFFLLVVALVGERERESESWRDKRLLLRHFRQTKLTLRRPTLLLLINSIEFASSPFPILDEHCQGNESVNHDDDDDDNFVTHSISVTSIVMMMIVVIVVCGCRF